MCIGYLMVESTVAAELSWLKVYEALAVLLACIFECSLRVTASIE